MDFRVNDNQRELQAAVRDVCRRSSMPDWAALSDLGIFSLRRPTALEGLGLSMAEAALVFEELGSALVPGPLVGTHLAATHLNEHDGSARIGVARIEHAEHVVTDARGQVDALLVWSGASVYEIHDLELAGAQEMDSLDPATPLARIAPPPPLGQPLPVDGDLLWQEGLILAAAYQVGVAAEVIDRTVSYLGTRQQFGRLIGSFQAVKHLAADMFVRLELARAATRAAAASFAELGRADRAEVAHTAKLLADQAAVTNSETAVQLHGGLGFTWDSGIHMFLKRAVVSSATMGAAAEHRAEIAATVAAED